MCSSYHKWHFPYPFITFWSWREGELFFSFSPRGLGSFSPEWYNISSTLGTEPFVCTQYRGIFSADTSQAGMHTLYLHSQRHWQMVGDKRSIPWSCRRTISTDPRFQSLKDTVQQPNRSTAQHSARSKAGAWNVCQDSLIQKCLSLQDGNKSGKWVWNVLTKRCKGNNLV